MFSGNENMRECKYKKTQKHLNKKDNILCSIRNKTYPIDRKCTNRCQDYVKKSLTTLEKVQLKNTAITEYMKENPTLEISARGHNRPCKHCESFKKADFLHCLHCGGKLK